MNALLLSLALTGVVPVPLTAPVPDQTLQEVRASDDEEDAGGTPDGCLHKYLCYSLPGRDIASTDWIVDDQVKFLLIHGLARFFLGFIPLSTFWLPFLLHFTIIPDDERPAMEGDLLLGTLLLAVGSYLLALGLIPLLYLPLGGLVYLGVNLVWGYWIVPVTSLHLYNTAVREQGLGGGSSGTKKKSARKKRIERDEEEDEEED